MVLRTGVLSYRAWHMAFFPFTRHVTNSVVIEKCWLCIFWACIFRNDSIPNVKSGLGSDFACHWPVLLSFTCLGFFLSVMVWLHFWIVYCIYHANEVFQVFCTGKLICWYWQASVKVLLVFPLEFLWSVMISHTVDFPLVSNRSVTFYMQFLVIACFPFS